MHEPSIPRLMTRRRFLLAPVAVSLLPARGLLHADEQKPEKDDFVSLFNGRDLDGWHANRARLAHGTGGFWRVEDGVLVGQQDPPGSGNGGLLLSDQEYADFELLIDMHSGYDKNRVFKILGRSGSIGLRVHGEKVWPNGAKCRWPDPTPPTPRPPPSTSSPILPPKPPVDHP